MSAKIDFLYLSEPDMIKAGVKDMASCVEVMEDMLVTLYKGDYVMGGANHNSHGCMITFPDDPQFEGMPKNADDVVRLLKLTNDIRQKYPTLPVVTMSMGALGVVSRMAGEIFGSCITFGAVGEISAPGQIPAGQLKHILQIIHKGLE